MVRHLSFGLLHSAAYCCAAFCCAAYYCAAYCALLPILKFGFHHALASPFFSFNLFSIFQSVFWFTFQTLILGLPGLKYIEPTFENLEEC